VGEVDLTVVAEDPGPEGSEAGVFGTLSDGAGLAFAADAGDGVGAGLAPTGPGEVGRARAPKRLRIS